MVVGTQIGLPNASLGIVAEVVRLGVPGADLRDGAFAGLAGKVPGGLGLGLSVMVGLGDGLGLGDPVGPGLGDGLGLGHFAFPNGEAAKLWWP